MRKRVFIVLTLVCLLISPIASSLPDGLETVLDKQQLSMYVNELHWPVMADYSFSLVSNSNLQLWLAGIIGVLIVVAISFALSLVARLRAGSKQMS